MKKMPAIGASMTLLLGLGLLAIGCGGDKNSGPGPDPGPVADVTIEIVANNGVNSYSPNPAVVQVGQTVSWHNAHNQTHTATANGGAFNTGNISPGSTSAPDSMKAAGSFVYRCTPHPSMVGTLQVNP